jgi:ETC complex I subunit conserved region
MTEWPLHCTNRRILASSCRGLKETTGLVGLEVDPEARSNVLAASQQVLAAVAEKIPKEAQYRANVEATMEHWIEKVCFLEPAEHTHAHCCTMTHGHRTMKRTGLLLTLQAATHSSSSGRNDVGSNMTSRCTSLTLRLVRCMAAEGQHGRRGA